VPGAWRALDEDLSGYITLHEIDPTSSETLVNFKKWCDQEFGGVKSAFQVFDSSGDNEVSYREFRRSCRIYGYDGHVGALFYALDVENCGSLTLTEVEFLDEWELPDERGAEADEIGGSMLLDDSSVLKSMPSEVITDYCTEGPGPGAYNLPCTFGASPATPMVTCRGAFTFRKRPQVQALPGLGRVPEELPAPNAYNVAAGVGASPRKPEWGFGSERRVANEPPALDTGRPGPGNYSPAVKRGAAAITCTPRRPLRMHPLCRGAGFLPPQRAIAPLCHVQGNLPLMNG